MEPLFQYSVIRHVNDVVRDEAVNVGVIIKSADGKQAAIKLLPPTLVRRHSVTPPTPELLAELEAAVQHSIATGSPLGSIGSIADPDFLKRATSEFVGNIQIGQMHGTFAPSLEEAVKRAYARYVEPPGRGAKPAVAVTLAPSRLRQRMFAAFQKDKLIRRGLVTRHFSVPGTHANWSFDLGYRNGRLSLINSLSLSAVESQTNLSRALVLKGMVEEVRAVTRDDVNAVALVAPPPATRSHAFPEANQILSDAGVTIVPLSDLDRLVSRARQDLTGHQFPLPSA